MAWEETERPGKKGQGLPGNVFALNATILHPNREGYHAWAGNARIAALYCLERMEHIIKRQ